MSIKLMTQVWEAPEPSGSERLVLLALADSANDEGYCWPSVATVARKAALSEKQARRVLHQLEQDERIQIIPRKDGVRNHSNMYLVLPPRGGGYSRPGEEGTPADGSRVLPPMGGRTVTEPSTEPSLNHANGRAERIVSAVTRGAARRFELEMEIQKEFHISPNWKRRDNTDFMDWLVSRPPDQTVADFARWWRTQDWRGKQGQPPTLSLIWELWPQAFVSLSPPIEGVPPGYDPAQDEKLQEYVRSRMK